MYQVTAIAAPGDPVTAEQLRAHLRLNDAAEDEALTEFLGAAVDLFEHDTGRPVLATTYRQDLEHWPCGPIVLGRGGVTAVNAVRVYNADGSATALAADQWRADLVNPRPTVTLASTPGEVTTAAGIAVRPVGCVEFVAGWTPAQVPKLVRVGLKLLAGHWYQNREAYQDREQKETPDGWKRMVSRYRTGLSGDWGQ